MQESSQHYFYLWRNPIVLDDGRIVFRTCFGITGHLDDRQNKYEGHVGHPVKFEHVWVSTQQRLIRELESRVKSDFGDYMFRGHRNYQYEWITEEIEYDKVIKYVEWEVGKLIGVEKII